VINLTEEQEYYLRDAYPGLALTKKGVRYRNNFHLPGKPGFTICGRAAVKQDVKWPSPLWEYNLCAHCLRMIGLVKRVRK